MRQADEYGPGVGPQVIFGIDDTGRCTLSVGAGLEALGLAPGELVGKNLFALYGHDARAVEALHRVLAGQTFSVEREFDGRRLWVYYEPVRDAAGTVTGALGVSTDVTEQRRIEGEARDARERAGLLAALSQALNREVLDPEALLSVAVRSMTEAVAELGVILLPTPAAERLEPRALWSGDDDVRSFLDVGGAGSSDLPMETDAAAGEIRAVALDTPEGRAGCSGALGRGAERFELTSGLRVPLRSRGHLLGIVELARGPGSGPFTDTELALVADMADRCALALDNALLLRARSEAREQLVKFKALADASDDLIGIVDDNARILYINPRVLKEGIEPFEDDVWVTLTGLVGEPRTAEIRTALDATGRWSGDLVATFPTGEIVVQVHIARLSHPDTGAPLGTSWLGQDVTELRATRTALECANSDLKQFKALVEASPDFIAIAGLDARVRYVNPRGRELVGLDPGVDVTTTTIADYLTPEGLEASVRIEQPAVIAEGHWEGESTLRNDNGPPTPVAIASFLMHDAETGEPFALATVQRDISDRLAAETALHEMAEQREALLTRLVDAQDAERAHIAADVHDDPVQALAAVDLRLGLLRRQLRERCPDLLPTLEPLEASVTGATDRLRLLLFDLEPPDLARGLTGALNRAAKEIFEDSPTRWTVDGDLEPDVPDATRAIAYRIAKEALINARKHAGAQHVTVRVAGYRAGLEVTVADDGVGLGPTAVDPSPGHRGLFSMQDRAAVAGGKCSIVDRGPHGTLVTIWLPAVPNSD